MKIDGAALVNASELDKRWGVSTSQVYAHCASLGVAPVKLRTGTNYWSDDLAAAEDEE